MLWQDAQGRLLSNAAGTALLDCDGCPCGENVPQTGCRNPCVGQINELVQVQAVLTLPAGMFGRELCEITYADRTYYLRHSFWYNVPFGVTDECALAMACLEYAWTANLRCHVWCVTAVLGTQTDGPSFQVYIESDGESQCRAVVILGFSEGSIFAFPNAHHACYRFVSDWAERPFPLDQEWELRYLDSHHSGGNQTIDCELLDEDGQAETVLRVRWEPDGG